MFGQQEIPFSSFNCFTVGNLIVLHSYEREFSGEIALIFLLFHQIFSVAQLIFQDEIRLYVTIEQLIFLGMSSTRVAPSQVCQRPYNGSIDICSRLRVAVISPFIREALKALNKLRKKKDHNQNIAFIFEFPPPIEILNEGVN